MTLRLLPVVGAVVAVAGWVGTAAPASAQDAYTLKRTFKAGEVDRYKTTMLIESETGMKVEIVFETTEKTDEVKPDGSMVRSIKIESAQLKVNGQTMAVPGFQPTKLTASFDKDGKPLKEEGQAGQFREFLSMTRPITEAEKPLKVGEEWKTEIPANKDGTKKLNVTVTLVGLEPRSDTVAADAFKIKTVAEGMVEGPNGDQNVRVETTSLVRRDSGRPLRIEGTVSGVSAAPFGPAKIKFQVVRQPDKPADAK